MDAKRPTKKQERLDLKNAGWKLELSATYNWLYKGELAMMPALEELNKVIFAALRAWEKAGQYGVNGANYSITNLEVIQEPKPKKAKERKVRDGR